MAYYEVNMERTARCEQVQDLLVLYAPEPIWPNPCNIFIIRDDSGFIMIDVGRGGPGGPEHLQRGLDHLGLSLKDLHTIVLSHAHPDHMGCMWWIMERCRPRVLIHHLDVISALNPENLVHTFDIPLAKALTAGIPEQEINRDFDLFDFLSSFGCPVCGLDTVDEIREGENLRLGSFEFEILNTPGHSPGHISLFDRERGLLLPGDLVGPSPAWYTPASGGAIGYINSLDDMDSLPVEFLIPAHGDLDEDPKAAIDAIRRKLLKRESILLDTLTQGPKSFWALNTTLFRSGHLHFFPGACNTESHLIRLETLGRVTRDGDMFSLS